MPDERECPFCRKPTLRRREKEYALLFRVTEQTLDRTGGPDGVTLEHSLTPHHNAERDVANLYRCAACGFVAAFMGD